MSVLRSGNVAIYRPREGTEPWLSASSRARKHSNLVIPAFSGFSTDHSAYAIWYAGHG